MARLLFDNTGDLITRIKSDLAMNIYPDLLERLMSGSVAYLENDLTEKAKQIGDYPPVISKKIFKVPPPGKATIGVEFEINNEAVPGGAIKTPAQAASYKEVFDVMFREKLGDKAGLLRLLAATGLT